ncbi:MAG: DUF4214 domain-containing protein, partial [Acidimicrobiales bacterium]
MGAVAVAMSVAALWVARPADAAGINFKLQMGQRFLNSPSPARSIPIPLKIQVGPIRPFALAGINATSFSPIKDPLLGVTIFSSSEVKQIVLDTIGGLGDDALIGFKVNSFSHPDPTDFIIGGNCIGADGASTPACVATVTFTPKSPGAKTDPIKANVDLTLGMDAVETSLRAALANQGIKGQLINLIYPLIQDYVRSALTGGLGGALLDPIATASGVGIAGPFTSPSVFVKRQYQDFGAGSPSSAQVSTWVKNFEGGTSPIALIDQLRRADAWHGRVGPVTRLYSAYFLRTPDTSGLTYWTNKSRAGTRLYAISSTFAASSEFQRRYGRLTNQQFVQLVYQNVLGRSPDPSGLAYWKKQLDKGQTR